MFKTKKTEKTQQKVSGERKPVNVYVGSRLKMRRTMLGISQTNLGNRIGVTFQQIQKYEKGENGMRSNTLYIIAKILLVPVNYFFEDYNDITQKPAKEAKDFVKSNVNDREIGALIGNFTKIKNPLLRKSIATLAKNLKDKTDGGKSE